MKASQIVKINDVYTIKTKQRDVSIKVLDIIGRKLPASEVHHYYSIINEEQKGIVKQDSAFCFFTGKRWSKTGRPTKKNRRNLDNLSNHFS